jgi:hypothetical protein
MTDYIVTARITVSGADRAQLQSTLDAGAKELPGLAARYGVTITDVQASVDEA